MTKQTNPINYTFTKGEFSIHIHAHKGFIRESIRNNVREISYSRFRTSCASDRDLVECYAQGRLAEYLRRAA